MYKYLHIGEIGIDVLKEYRGTGVGTALMRDTLSAVRGKFEIIEASHNLYISIGLYTKLWIQ